MKKPYINKYGKVSDYTVWVVDGKYIRKNIDKEFTNWGYHLKYHFIPEHEFWIDKQYGEGDDAPFYIDAMLIMVNALKEGKSYNQAVKLADTHEKKERAKSRILEKEEVKRLDKEQILSKIRKRLLREYSRNGLRVYVVRGKIVRDKFFIDFTEGGHDKVYSFIPNGEVWLDDDISQKERKFILLHELFERNLMNKGVSYDEQKHKAIITHETNKPHNYESAHRAASEIEHFFRHHPHGIDKKIREEIKKSAI